MVGIDRRPSIYRYIYLYSYSCEAKIGNNISIEFWILFDCQLANRFI